MTRLLLLAAVLLICVSSGASAQVVEVTPSARFVTGDDIELGVDSFQPGDLHVKDGWGWGIGLGFASNPNVMFEGSYGHQSSGIEFHPLSGADVPIFDMDMHRIMANFIFSKPGQSEYTQPYFLLGLGSLVFDPKREGYDSIGKFSWQIGLGLKHQFGDGGMGIRLQALFDPTYLTSEAEGYWCDPFYGCYTSADYHYLNQFDFSVGLTKKFGTYR